MSENMENSTPNTQENSEKSENIQDNSQENPELNTSSAEETETSSDATGESDESNADDGDLPLPEPDIVEDEGKKKKEQPEWLKKRLDREKVAAERKLAEADRLKEENARLRAGYQPPQAPNIPQAPQNQQPHDPYMPQREQYATDGDYFLALGDYRDHKRQQESQFHARQAAIQQHEENFKKNLTDAVETGKSKYKDFEERTDYILYGDGFPSNRAMAEAIVESSYKDDILYFLGTNVKEAERIARLNPVQAAKEIAKIEVRFDSRKKSNITKAPKAIAPLGGGKGSATHGDPNKMGMDEFRQWYQDKFG